LYWLSKGRSHFGEHSIIGKIVNWVYYRLKGVGKWLSFLLKKELSKVLREVSRIRFPRAQEDFYQVRLDLIGLGTIG